MSNSIASILKELPPDKWRQEVGFSEDVEAANDELFRDGVTNAAAAQALNEWIKSNQPCLFGRMAARSNQIAYCVLLESDLAAGDEHIRDKIQEARERWTAEAFEGTKSGFVILAVSKSAAFASPGPQLQRLAESLASLYLLRPVEPDVVCHDEVWLEIPGNRRRTFSWYAGVNVFAAQGDKRWWHDHRIPGGIALSINSVGHMVKSGLLAKAMGAFDNMLGIEPSVSARQPLNSLGDALELAMRTIANASNAVSGPATQLLHAPADATGEGSIQFRSKQLAGKDHDQYVGWYHTDVTVPSEYFRPDVTRSTDIQRKVLDFTYLFDAAIDNPDHITMGLGRPIREPYGAVVDFRSEPPRSRKFNEAEIDIVENSRLARALERKPRP
jgi:hypothetical protein